jgi:hypothetical protein
MIILKGCKITMERLTESNPSWIDDELWESACEPDCEEIDAVYRKLKEYEDLEEQGRLIKLPCKVGDGVYYILGIPNKTPCVIDKCKFELSDINKIGKTLFLTREEAEAKLKELRDINSETNRNEIEEIER